MSPASSQSSPGKKLNWRCFLGVMADGLVYAKTGPGASVAARMRRRFRYAQGPLVMTDDALHDANGHFSLTQLPAPDPRCPVQRKGDIIPLTERLWKIALDDVERNRVTHESGTLPDGLIEGSGHPLWSAADFLNVCVRAGLVV